MVFSDKLPASRKSWIGEGEYAKPVIYRIQFEPKIMVSVFFKSPGLVHIHFLEERLNFSNLY